MKQPSARDDALLRALEAEERLAAEFYTSEIQEDQIEAFKRYYGQPYGDEVEGRSQVVSRETMETVEWTRGDLRRVFSAGGRIVECDAQTEQEDDYAEDAADYLNYVFFRENPGQRLLSSFIFDGLLQKRGYLACFWREPEYGPPQKVELNLVQFQEVLQQPNVELTEEPEVEEAETPEATIVKATLVEVVKQGHIEVQCIAPEDMRVNARYESLDEMPAKGHDLRITVSELIKEYPEHEKEIRDRAGTEQSEFDDDERRLARFSDEEQDLDGGRASSDLVEEVIVKVDYIHFDYDDDGYAELRHVKRLGNLILENEEVEEDPYASWTPNHIPHKFFGLSTHDEIADIERVKTVTTRSALDAMYQAVAPRAVVDKNTIDLASALTLRAGGLILNDGPAKDGFMPVTVPDVSAPALAMSEYWDKLAERRTGVQRRAQAMDPDALHDTYKGEKLLQNAASVRKEDKAANCAEGLEALFSKMYRLCCTHMDGERSVRLRKGRDIRINPANWRKDMRLTVHVGLGTGARDEQLAYLQMVQADQVAWISQFGFSEEGQGGVTPAQVFNLTEEKLRVMGFRSPGQFFTEPQPGWRPQPPPNPEIQKAQMQAEAKQQEMQLSAQLDQAKLQAETANDQAKLASESQMKQAEMATEGALKQQQIEAEIALKERQLAAELDLKWRMFLMELEMKERIAEKQISAGVASGGGGASKANGSAEVRVGGDPG